MPGLGGPGEGSFLSVCRMEKVAGPECPVAAETRLWQAGRRSTGAWRGGHHRRSMQLEREDL